MRMKIYVLLPILCFLLYGSEYFCVKKSDLVIFSYDRPLQLFALLESVEHYIFGLNNVSVIYKVSNNDFDKAYEEVKKDFSNVKFLKQSEKDFKIMTLNAAFNKGSDYIMFAVDDQIVKDYIDVSSSIKLLEKENAYGFFFKLGLHLNWCYTRNCSQPLPSSILVSENICFWHFFDGVCDWGYPHTLDMTLYRKKDIEFDLRRLNYKTPNSLESAWACLTNNIKNKKGLCYKSSKVVNLPINKVQTENNNIHMNLYSKEELLFLFNDGMKIAIAPLFNMENKSVHEEYGPSFVKKDEDFMEQLCLKSIIA